MQAPGEMPKGISYSDKDNGTDGVGVDITYQLGGMIYE
jgi:hypothetical protein